MGRVPALRFPGFSREWREVKLGEIATFVKDKIDIQEIDVYSYISTENILQDYAGIVPSSKPPSVSRVTKFKKGDILISNIRPYLKKIWMATIDGGASNDVVVLRAKEAIKDGFLSTQLMRDRFIGYVMSGAKGVKMPRGDIKQVAVYTLYIPSLPEQQKISDFLSAVDAKITLSQEKITRLEAYKKGMMQKLLSGEVRFPGFTDTWREVKLGEISTISTGTSKSKFIQEKGKYLIVDMGSISSDGKLIASKKTNHNSDFLKAGILVMPKDDIGGGNIIGKTAYIDVDNKYIMGDHIYKISIIQDNSKFIHYLINSYKINKILRRRATGTAQLGLNKNSVSTVSFKLPSLPEQQKIADFLTAIDDKLTLEKERLEALKRYKQGLLQKMFV